MPCPDISDRYVETVNDYTLIVQQLFQNRVRLWLKTIGKEIFGIEHYWVRYEFAPSRGQIHAHLLAITNHHAMWNHYYQLEESQRPAFLCQWMEQNFDMATSVPVRVQSLCKETLNHPAKQTFQDSSLDGSNCLTCLQQHSCSKYCLRKRKRG